MSPALDRNKPSRREEVTGREDVARPAVPVAQTVEAEIIELPQDEIALLAYSYWEERGRPEGSPEERLVSGRDGTTAAPGSLLITPSVIPLQ